MAKPGKPPTFLAQYGGRLIRTFSHFQSVRYQRAGLLSKARRLPSSTSIYRFR
jgi:hypothetical protein